jgi:hypothetical protein
MDTSNSEAVRAAASERMSPESSAGRMPAPPPRTVEGSTGASSTEMPPPPPCSAPSAIKVDSNDNAMAPRCAAGGSPGPQAAVRNTPVAQRSQQPGATMTTRSSQRAHNSTPKVDIRIAIQELTNVKANAAAGSAAAAAAAKAAAAAAAATAPSISSLGHSVPVTMNSGFLERPKALEPTSGLGMHTSMPQPWAPTS